MVKLQSGQTTRSKSAVIASVTAADDKNTLSSVFKNYSGCLGRRGQQLRNLFQIIHHDKKNLIKVIAVAKTL